MRSTHPVAGPRLPSPLFVIATLLVTLPLVTTGNVYLSAVAAVRLNLMAIDPTQVGLVLAMHSLGFVLGTLFSARSVRRIGHIRAFASFAAFNCVIALAYPLWESPWFWALLRFAGGITVAGQLTVVESWIAARSTNATRGQLFGAYVFFYYLAATGGQLMLGVTGVTGFVPFSIAAMLIVLSLVPLASGTSEAPAPMQPQRMPLHHLLRLAPLGVAGGFVGGVAASAFFNLGPVFAWQLGLDADGLAVFMASGIFGAMILQWPAGWLSDRYPRERLLMASLAIATAAAAVAAAVVEQGGWVANVLAGVFLGATSTIYPLCVADVNSRLRSTQLLPAATAMLLSYGIGTCVGPIGGALGMRWFGNAGLFWFCAVILFAMLLYAVVRAGRRSEARHTEPYVARVGATTPVLAELAETLTDEAEREPLEQATGAEASSER